MQKGQRRKAKLRLPNFGQVHSRLFDHRPFLNGEVRYFLHEFEEARGDREVENLFSILEETTDIHGDQAGRLISLCESQVPSIKARLDVAVSMCQQILEPDHCANKESCLEAKRAARKKEWELFMQDLSVKCASVDETFRIKEDELKTHYSEIEKKLIPTTASS
ncbi:unnamed protein product [Darwinula stevensoni]|uniref:Biogenesis of lysosome-related organelles complex 1 subunit 5 n=1 Tax=Darwinula stevensoni TaxID=69355 RepID=A0A7R8XHS2_9CRUS|nr:unnamed protein product [Darwinula stevensoni]CAG0893118.1 unnamed protein product [Darwinula stevensoni]